MEKEKEVNNNENDIEEDEFTYLDGEKGIEEETPTEEYGSYSLYEALMEVNLNE